MIVGSRFNGPPGSGNGGYTAGLVAVEVAAAKLAGIEHGIEVTLRLPPPLDTPLTVQPVLADGGEEPTGLRVFAGPDLVAEAKPAMVGPDDVAPPVSHAEAVAAAANYRGLISHPFPTCFVCGPARAPGDGLRLSPGRLADQRTAAPFTAPAEVGVALMWACLDCPGGWAAPLESRDYVLGRIAARVDALPAAGDECVVVGQCTGEAGRKAFVRSTLYGPSGALLATARATWIAR
ncbi:MAG TPA: hypothetical protein VF163_21850 [Micromonosporaceae bacterium]